MELKLEAKRKALDLLKYKSPEIESKRFIQYKNINLTQFNIVNTVTVEGFYNDLQSAVENLKQEVSNNIYSEHFTLYKNQLKQDTTDNLSGLKIGLQDAVKMLLLFADIDDFSELDFNVVRKKIPINILAESKISALYPTIRRQIWEAEDLLKWINDFEVNFSSTPIDSSQEFASKSERKKNVQKINSNLKKNEIVTMFWLLNRARFLKFENNKHLAEFLENNFRYTRAGVDVDLAGVEIEISRLEDFQIERMQEDLIQTLQTEMADFNADILNTLATMKIVKPKKDT